jgi:hypothetical protein
MSQLSPGQYFRRLKVIHATLVFLQVVLLLLAIYLRNRWMRMPEGLDVGVLRMGVPLLALAGLYSGNRLFRRRLKQAFDQSTLARKLFYYRWGFYYRSIFWSLPSVLAIAAWFLTGVWMYLGVTALFVALLVVHRPDIDRARRELQL